MSPKFNKDNYTQICLGCGVPKLKIRSSGTTKSVWRDERGLLWNGNTCRDCRRLGSRTRARKKGIKPREEVTEPRWEKAVNSEKAVGAWFEKRGFQVSYTEGSGPDLVCIGGEARLTVEVKSVSSQLTRGQVYWVVGGVSDLRKSDDLIAILLPSGRIHFEDMSAHLRKCRTNGFRSVTRLVREDYEFG